MVGRAGDTIFILQVKISALRESSDLPKVTQLASEAAGQTLTPSSLSASTMWAPPPLPPGLPFRARRTSEGWSKYLWLMWIWEREQLKTLTFPRKCNALLLLFNHLKASGGTGEGKPWLTAQEAEQLRTNNTAVSSTQGKAAFYHGQHQCTRSLWWRGLYTYPPVDLLTFIWFLQQSQNLKNKNKTQNEIKCVHFTIHWRDVNLTSVRYAQNIWFNQLLKLHLSQASSYSSPQNKGFVC